MNTRHKKTNGLQNERTGRMAAIQLYRDHNPYWSSSLFNEVYLRNDVPQIYARFLSGNAEFELFHNSFHNFVLEQEVEDASTWSESDTIANWIVPVMQMLGWHDKCEGRQNPYLSELSLTAQVGGMDRTYRLDLAYVDEPKHKQYIKAEKSAAGRLREAQSEHTGVKLVVEAKYWDRLEQYRQGAKEDKKRADIAGDDATRSLSPDDQILQYLEVLKRDFGILTDGKTWRLYHREHSKGDVRRYFEFDLGNLARLLQGGIDTNNRREEFLINAGYFFLFFRKGSLVQQSTGVAPAYEILEYSKKYVSTVEEDLKGRFISAMGLMCNAIRKSIGSSKGQADLNLIRDTAESHLFNILFIRSCETRKILPLHAPDYLKLSITEIIESFDHMSLDPRKELADFDSYFKSSFGPDFDLKGTDLYDRIVKLYSVVSCGNVGFGVHGFRESVLSPEEWNLVKAAPVTNESMIEILFTLNFSDSEHSQRKYQQIPYNLFTPRQLGSIYESFLEYKLEVATNDMVFQGRDWAVANLQSTKVRAMNLDKRCIAKQGDLIFCPGGTDRKQTGSYYTPDSVVQFMVQEAMTSKVSNLASSDILKMSVCDPAMGSGHFLNAALQRLTFAYRAQLSEEALDDIDESFEESARRVLGSCIYGVDLNPRAVKLTKLSLWLATAQAGRKLERLDDQLKCADSITRGGIDWKKTFPHESTRSGFDLVIGNPPYGNIASLEVSAMLQEDYATFAAVCDVYVCFMEMGLRVANEDGIVGYIVPSAWLGGPGYRALRELMLMHKVEMVATMPFDVFPDAYVDTCVFFVRKARSVLKGHKVRTYEFPKKFNVDHIGRPQKYSQVDQASWSKSNDKKFVLNPAAINIMDDLKRTSSSTLGDLAAIKRGVLFDKTELERSKRNAKFLKYFEGDVYRYSINLEGRGWIEVGDRLKEGPKDTCWYTGPRILLRRLVNRQKRLMAMATDAAYVTNKNLYIVKPNDGVSCEYVLALLNSKLFSFLYLSQVPQASKDDFPQVTIRDLRSIPIPQHGKKSAKISKIVSLVKRIVMKNATSAKMDAEIDQLIYDLFELNSAQREEVEQFFAANDGVAASCDDGLLSLEEA